MPAWKPDAEVRFPLELIPKSIRGEDLRGRVYIARVNIGAVREEELFFENFEAAPEPAGLDSGDS